MAGTGQPILPLGEEAASYAERELAGEITVSAVPSMNSIGGASAQEGEAPATCADRTTNALIRGSRRAGSCNAMPVMPPIDPPV